MIHLAQMVKVLQKLDGKEMLMILDSITWALMLRKKRKTTYKNSRIFFHWEQIHSRQIRTITRTKLIWPTTLDNLWANPKSYLSKHHPSNNSHLSNNHLNNSSHHLILVNLLSQKKWLNLQYKLTCLAISAMFLELDLLSLHQCKFRQTNCSTCQDLTQMQLEINQAIQSPYSSKNKTFSVIYLNSSNQPLNSKIPLVTWPSHSLLHSKKIYLQTWDNLPNKSQLQLSKMPI